MHHATATATFAKRKQSSYTNLAQYLERSMKFLGSCLWAKDEFFNYPKKKEDMSSVRVAAGNGCPSNS